MSELPSRPELREGWSDPYPHTRDSHYIRNGDPVCGLPGFYGGPVRKVPPDDSDPCLDCMIRPGVTY